MIRRVLLLVSLAAAAGWLSGCAGDESSEREQVSSIPWNHPQKWEGQGPLGGFSPQGSN